MDDVQRKERDEAMKKLVSLSETPHVSSVWPDTLQKLRERCLHLVDKTYFKHFSDYVEQLEQRSTAAESERDAYKEVLKEYERPENWVPPYEGITTLQVWDAGGEGPDLATAVLNKYRNLNE